jgi:hypothetical protein
VRIGHKPVEALNPPCRARAWHLQRRANSHQPQVQPNSHIRVSIQRGQNPVRRKQSRGQNVAADALSARQCLARLGFSHHPTVPNALDAANTEGAKPSCRQRFATPATPAASRQPPGSRAGPDTQPGGMVHTWESASGLSSTEAPAAASRQPAE